MNIQYKQFGRSDYKDITDMIHALYKEDPPGMPMSTEKITNTLNEFEKHPDKGTIMVLKNGPNVIGYSILANFWSNEFGGNVLIIDELYIKEVYRSQGIGTNFIKHLKDSKCVRSREHLTPAASYGEFFRLNSPMLWPYNWK